MARLMAKKNVTVYGKEIGIGEEFEVPDNEAHTWRLLGMAVDVDAPPIKRGPGRPRKYDTADLTDNISDRSSGGRYSRSDMRPED